MNQTDQQTRETFREQCRRQMDRPLAFRIKHGFHRSYKPVREDAVWCSVNSMAEYGRWCEKHRTFHMYPAAMKGEAAFTRGCFPSGRTSVKLLIA